MVVRTKPVSKVAPRATRTASAPAPARKPVPARKAAPSKPAPAAKAATPARKAPATRTTAQKAQITTARASKAAKETVAKETAAKSVNIHPTRQEEVSAFDVLRAKHTYETLYATWLRQQGEEISEVLEFVAPIMSARPGPVQKSPGVRAKVAPADRVIEEYYDRDKIEALPLKGLRTLAVDLAAQNLITETVKKNVILEQMEAAGLFREEGDADADEDDIEDDVDEDDEEDVAEDEDESEDDDDEEYGEETYTREELEEMELKELQELAEVNEMKWRGLDKAELIDAMLGAEEESEDEEEDEEEEEGEDEGEVMEIDPAELENMSASELLDLCEQLEIEVPKPKRTKKDALIELILDNSEEEDEE